MSTFLAMRSRMIEIFSLSLGRVLYSQVVDPGRIS